MSRRQQNPSHVFDSGVFDRKSPRPPVPGEERVPYVSDFGQMEYHPSPKSGHPRKTVVQNDYKSSSESIASREERCYDGNASPLACLEWARSLHCLLEDPDGVDLFKEYLKEEGKPHVDALEFWFACEGLREQSEPNRTQLIKFIYKRFFIKSALPIGEDCKREVTRRVKSSEVQNVYDEAQAQVERHINFTTYANFIKSDKYLYYIQTVQNPTGGDLRSSREASLACSVDPLPIIYEDSEFSQQQQLAHGHTPGTGCTSTGYDTPTLDGPMKLTKDMLLLTQKNRAMDVRPKPEAYAANMYRGSAHPYQYSSYNPVSRQDSEIQSLSSHSDARTESDKLSRTGSSIDERHRAARRVRQNAAMNRETHMQETLIPRTQRQDMEKCRPLPPDQFANILIDKLENLKRNQDQQERLRRKMKENENAVNVNDKSRRGAQFRELAKVMRERLQVEDDTDQGILDAHVCRVFPDKPARLDKDGFSLYSCDSGNVHDYAEGSDHVKVMVKSKSMPERDRFMRGNNPNRRCSVTSSKKTLNDFTDSGVSVYSDVPPTAHAKNQRLWHQDVDCRNSASYTSSEPSSSSSSKHRPHPIMNAAASPTTNRHMPDPGMPLLPPPNIDEQLEEARRRLKEDDMRTRSRQRKYYPEMQTQSSQSTLRKSMRGPRPSTNDSEEVTSVVFSFCDERLPYRTKIPGRQITLRQFKEYLPKKGNYEYFFKTECEELDKQAIQLKVSNDTDVLPLWEGRINALVKPID
ncbi:PREDICTED: axin isoform X1 [Nicrophorus vespilloides]|uniref:Axin isoform X1 n=1 Tax=Nicrophorus vespilloides TaxID=110193 RepID=A0ABM1M8R4_NICVS|nr:PREDICTED: axin isoform X1 [Nicrophorus vespilloides]XP_017770963.1 PREDICTED: axin isoform X1 [Nicrophorus vespilloides]XP_017770964.1 PREDICTED: axin isoform X1 [Nicrophorus vespilloides]XP_017770965.1 PREDICTED: axin isoform X1 [Nicrophorus vespilloides]XP_017770966.1 PREDICTED: axin isoform X1 [Nicrophorus vespilloides]